LIRDDYLTAKARNTLLAVLVDEVARNESLEMKYIGRGPLPNLLKEFFLDTPWKGIVPMRVAGAAFERLYRMRDALRFYALVWRGEKIPCSEDDQNYALERWIKLSFDYAQYLEEYAKGLLSDRTTPKKIPYLSYEETMRRASQYREEAEEVCMEYGIEKENIPMHPQISDIENDYLPKEALSWKER